MRFALLSFFTVLLLGICGPKAEAVCFKDGISVDPSNGPVIPWPIEFRKAPVVLIGMVVSEKNIPDPKEAGFWSGMLYTLRVEALLKGHAGTLVQVFSPNDSGRLPLATGTRYILFLHDEGGQLSADACGNSAKLVSPFG